MLFLFADFWMICVSETDLLFWIPASAIAAASFYGAAQQTIKDCFASSLRSGKQIARAEGDAQLNLKIIRNAGVLLLFRTRADSQNLFAANNRRISYCGWRMLARSGCPKSVRQVCGKY